MTTIRLSRARLCSCLLATLLAAATHYLFLVSSRWLTLRRGGDLRMRLAIHLMGLSMRYHAARRLGDLNSRISSDVTGTMGMVLDVLGNIYLAAGGGESGGVYVFSPSGAQIGFVQTPEPPTNCTFGGSDLQTLYITATTSVYSTMCNQPGFLAFPRNPCSFGPF